MAPAMGIIANTDKRVWVAGLVLVGVFCLAEAYTPGGSWGERSFGPSINPLLVAVGAALLVGAFLVYRRN